MNTMLAILLILSATVGNAQTPQNPFKPVLELSVMDGYVLTDVRWLPSGMAFALHLKPERGSSDSRGIVQVYDIEYAEFLYEAYDSTPEAEEDAAADETATIKAIKARFLGEEWWTSPDGSLMAGVDSLFSIGVYDTASGEALYSLPTPEGHYVTIAGSDGWRFLYHAGAPEPDESYFGVWDAETREVKLRFNDPLGYRRVSIANGTVIVEDFTSNRRYQVYSVDDGFVFERGGLDAMPSFSPDHRWALNLVESAAGKPDTVVLDDLQTGAGTLIETGIAGRVWFRWSPDASAFAMYRAETDSVIVWRNKD